MANYPDLKLYVAGESAVLNAIESRSELVCAAWPSGAGEWRVVPEVSPIGHML
jgi:hypothetical protein